METEPLANTAGNDRGESLQNQEITAPKQKSSLLNKKIKKKIYLKLNKDQLHSLQDSFVMTEFYPKKSQINKIADELDIDVTKIENWLKYERRKLSKLLVLEKYKKRKRFSERDIEYLQHSFKTNINPSKSEIECMAKNISCHPKNIENWFGNYKKKIKNQGKSSTNTRRSKKSQVSNSSINTNQNHIKLEESLNTTQQSESFQNINQIQTPCNDLSSNQQNLNDPFGFLQNLQSYMTNPDILEIQRKNLALTQNFMIYQQRFQVFMMMNLKSMLNNPTITMPTSIKIEEQGVKMTETQKNKDNEKKNEKNLALEQIATQIKQENPFNQGGLKREIPDSLKNMINFLHNSFKENLSKDDLPK